MIAFLLTMLMVQGIPALPGQTGSVSGIVRTSAGLPAAGVRVSAMVPPEVATDAASASSLASFSALAQTDAAGRYRLEGIPVGRYYIVAGRVDLPTYYPGTADQTQARMFSIESGGTVSGIDFVIVDNSIRPASALDNAGLPFVAVSIPVRVLLEGGAKLPVFASGGFTSVRFVGARPQAARAYAIESSFSINLSVPIATPEFSVRVENLPDGYVVKSITYGADSVTTNKLKIPSALLLGAAAGTALPALPELNITLAVVDAPEIPGARVTGSLKDAEVRSVYISGMPGTLYSDGSFEFRGVLSGRHSIAALGTSPAPSLGASIVVGDRNIEGVELEVGAILPRDVSQSAVPGVAGNHAAGSVLPLASLRGRVLEQASGKPIEGGTIKLVGRNSSVVDIGSGGEFEFSRLVPGSYDLELRIFGQLNVLQTVVVGDEDLRMDLKTLP